MCLFCWPGGAESLQAIRDCGAESLQASHVMTTNSLELEELNAKSAGIGTWVVKCYGMQWIEYEYTRQNTVQKGQKVEGFLLAQSGAYCHGVIKAKWGNKE